MSYGAETGPLAIAHRGGAGLAPANTLAAFARATAARGRVASRTVRGVRSLRVAGVEQVPTLVEALEAFPEARFTVDLKDAAAIAPLVRVLRRPGVAERVCVAGAW